MQCHEKWIFVVIFQVIYPSFANNHLKAAVDSIQSIKASCGDICDVSKEKRLPQSGPYFPYAWNTIDCLHLFEQSWDELGPWWNLPPRWKHLPSPIQKELTWNGLFSVNDWYFNDNWNISDQIWTTEAVERLQSKYSSGYLSGNYGLDSVKRLSTYVV